MFVLILSTFYFVLYFVKCIFKKYGNAFTNMFYYLLFIIVDKLVMFFCKHFFFLYIIDPLNIDLFNVLKAEPQYTALSMYGAIEEVLS